jgi:hypothetical protein
VCLNIQIKSQKAEKNLGLLFRKMRDLIVIYLLLEKIFEMQEMVILCEWKLRAIKEKILRGQLLKFWGKRGINELM